jgi:uncharacterized protein YbjT (DUF2867 family)
MRIVIIGDSGLIDSRTATILRQAGHHVVAASSKLGINTITGDGLKLALTLLGHFIGWLRLKPVSAVGASE